MTRGPDAATLLRRALERSADAAGIELEVMSVESRAWASATFNGARHVLRVAMPVSEVAACWRAALPELDLPVRGQLVADIAVVTVEMGDGRAVATVEALTLEER